MLVNVTAPSVDVEGCVLMNATSTVPIVGKGGLLYNVVHDAEVPAEAEAPRPHRGGRDP